MRHRRARSASTAAGFALTQPIYGLATLFVCLELSILSLTPVEGVDTPFFLCGCPPPLPWADNAAMAAMNPEVRLKDGELIAEGSIVAPMQLGEHLARRAERFAQLRGSELRAMDTVALSLPPATPMREVKRVLAACAAAGVKHFDLEVGTWARYEFL